MHVITGVSKLVMILDPRRVYSVKHYQVHKGGLRKRKRLCGDLHIGEVKGL